MVSDRDVARAEVGRRGLTSETVEFLARATFSKVPISRVERARTLLRRYFSDDQWSVEEESALAGMVGPGQGWSTHELAPDLSIEYGWRAGTFRVEAKYVPTAATEVDAPPSAPGNEGNAPSSATTEHSQRTLGDTFDGGVVLEAGTAGEQVRFLTGPGSGGAETARTAAEARDPRVATLFQAFPDVAAVQLGPGFVTVELGDAHRWPDVLLDIFDRVVELFASQRAAPAPDRQLERARAELSGVDAATPRGLAKVVDALTSPDANFRMIAADKLALGDPFAAERGWRAAIEDSSRAVRRAAARAIASVARADLRPLLERALADSDACVRYYGVRGLALVGIGRSLPQLQRLRRDDDLRVRLATEAAMAGRIPA